VSVIGNLKFDLPLDAALPARGAALRTRWAPGRAVWIAGSTHAGEEAILVEAQRQMLAAVRASGGMAPLLVLAPRRPERFAAVGRWLAAQDLRYASSIAPVPPSAGLEVLLIDQMGVLQDWYAAASWQH
jgi:3-deoxy-D-manno-octulosonic-acid transferase